jgi:hypothetical protein
VLDDHLHVALQKFEYVLAIGKSILSAHLFQPPEKGMLQALFILLHSGIELKEEIEAALGFTISRFPRIPNRFPLAFILGNQIQ